VATVRVAGEKLKLSILTSTGVAGGGAATGFALRRDQATAEAASKTNRHTYPLRFIFMVLLFYLVSS